MSIIISSTTRPGLYLENAETHEPVYIMEGRIYNPSNLRFIGHETPDIWTPFPFSFTVDSSGSHVLILGFANTFMYYQRLPNGRFVELLPRERENLDF